MEDGKILKSTLNKSINVNSLSTVIHKGYFIQWVSFLKQDKVWDENILTKSLSQHLQWH